MGIKKGRENLEIFTKQATTAFVMTKTTTMMHMLVVVINLNKNLNKLKKYA